MTNVTNISQAKKRIIKNWYEIEVGSGDKTKTKKIAKEATQVTDEIQASIWPGKLINVGGILHYVSKETKTIVSFKRCSEFFGYMGYLVDQFSWVNFPELKDTSFFVTIAQLVEQYDDIEPIAQIPRQSTVYVNADIEPYPTGKFLELLKLFNPASDVDMSLLMAAFLTPFWGKAEGLKPAFAIEAEDGDGRGFGKTFTASKIGKVAGGSIMVSNYDSQLYATLLNAETSARVVIFDNVKSNKLSSQMVEALITSDQISGKLMYVGTRSRPNSFTYIFTLNDASLSQDMSQRVVRIKLKKHFNDSTSLLSDVDQFIDLNIDEIRAEMLYWLDKYSRQNVIFKEAFRFPKWAKCVLAACTNDIDSCLREIKERQGEVDSDDDKGNFESYLVDSLSSYCIVDPTDKDGTTEHGKRNYDVFDYAWAISKDTMRGLIERHTGQKYRSDQKLGRWIAKNCPYIVTKRYRAGTGRFHYYCFRFDANVDYIFVVHGLPNSQMLLRSIDIQRFYD